jgi:primosomal replication protein N
MKSCPNSEEQNANLAQLKYPINYHGKQQTDLTSDNGRRITLKKFLSL